MIIYNVTVSINGSVHKDWLEWMKKVHIPEVMSTGCFIRCEMFRVITPEDEYTYSIQYVCNSFKEYENYRDIFAPGLQAAHAVRYKDQFVAFRTLLEKV